MSRHLGQAPASPSVIQQVPIGGFSNVFRSGDAYRYTGEVVSRSVYSALSAAFPRNGAVSASVTTTTGSSSWAGTAFGLGFFVSISTTGGVQTSPDGVNWTSRVSLPPITSRSYTGLAFGGGRFVAVAGGTSGQSTICYSSSDLLTWTAGTMPDTNWISVTYGTAFVAVSLGGIAATSSDGITWVQRTLPASFAPNRVVYGGGMYFAFNAAGGASSPDGATWTSRTLPTGTSWKDAAYGNGAFIIVGTMSTGYGMARSTDGITWNEVKYASLGTKVSLDTVGFGNGLHFVISAGTAWVSYDGGIAWIAKSIVSFSGQYTLYGNSRFFSNPAGASGATFCAFAETVEGTLSPSDDLYIQGTAGQLVRVK